MTLVSIGKSLLLEGSRLKMEDNKFQVDFYTFMYQVIQFVTISSPSWRSQKTLERVT